MNYKFQKISYSGKGLDPLYQFGVDLDFINKDELSLQHIESHLWTPQKIQKLIDDSNAIQGDNELQYQVEGGHLGIIVTKTDGVAFFDLTNKEKEEEDFIWTFEKFINFLKDFKKFVSENS